MYKADIKNSKRIPGIFASILILALLIGISPAFAQTGTISGTVYDFDGTNPIENITIWAVTDACGNTAYGPATTDVNGDYIITNLPEGDYYLRAYDYMSSYHYAAEWYDGTYDCNSAVAVTVAEGETTPDIDFHLDIGGTISGIVTESDGTTPIAGATVLAVPVTCSDIPGGDQFAGAGTNASGEYTTTGVPAGDVHVLVLVFAAPGVPGDYLPMYYNNALTCDEADTVTVYAGDDTAGIDFMLSKNTDSDTEPVLDDIDDGGDDTRDDGGDGGGGGGLCFIGNFF